jgi:hypothetical protein
MNHSDDPFGLLTVDFTVNAVLAVSFGLIEIIGILGNLLVILSVRFDARLRRSLTNRLIVHVASCDLIILLFNVPDLVQFVSSSDGNWRLDRVSCKLIRSVLVLAQYASVLTMCAVTIERCRNEHAVRSFVRSFTSLPLD